MNKDKIQTESQNIAKKVCQTKDTVT